MKISVPKERRPHERRVAASPDTVKRLVGMGLELVVETGAGAGASFTDDAYIARRRDHRARRRRRRSAPATSCSRCSGRCPRSCAR